MINSEKLRKEVRGIKIRHVVILCATVFVSFSILGAALIAASGTGNLSHAFTPAMFSVGRGGAFEINESADEDINGVNYIEVNTISSDVALRHGGQRLEANLRGRCRTREETLRLEVSRHGDTITVAVKHPDQSNDQCSSTLTITIPDRYQHDFSLGTVSGDFIASGLPQQFGAIAAQSVSGDITLGDTNFQKLRAGTTSGDIKLHNVTSAMKLQTVSGDVEVAYAKAAPTEINTVSGDVDVAMPGREKFNVEFQSTSGDFESTHSGLGARNAEKKFRGAAAAGDGPLLKVTTVSGDLELETR